MTGFELARPSSLSEAVALLAGGDPAVRPFSGGTALMLMMKTGVFQPTCLVSLAGIEETYSAITPAADGGLRIGAMASLREVERSPLVAQVAPVISRAMKRLSNVRVRNVARVGGNLAHGDPHMDLPPVLSALGATVTATGPAGARQIAVEKLFAGYYETVLAPGELITQVTIPAQAGWSAAYLKVTTRSADDWPALGVAAAVKLAGGIVADCRIMASAATEKLTRLAAAEAEIRGIPAAEGAIARAAEAAAAEAETIDDAQGSAAYKTALLRVHVRRALTEALRNGAAT